MTGTAFDTKLGLHDRVERPIVQAMIDWLCDGRRLRVLDAGCGPGAPALAFAELGCRVVGIDVDEDSLGTARELFAGTPHEEQVEFRVADMLALDSDDASFDLVWTSKALHHVADRPGAVRELLRVLRPGGRLAIREDGLPLQMLPFDIGLGEPGLQDRLRVAHNRWFDAMTRTTLPDAVPYPFGWAQLLVDNDLADVTVRTFTIDLLPPFDEVQAEFAVHQLQAMLARDAGEYGPVLLDADRDLLRRLLDPSGSHYLLKRRDLHIRYGQSVYVGRKPDAATK
jgi:SAM-dependent methyltransferase